MNECKLLRVGSRLDEMNIFYNAPHQLVLSESHPLTILIARAEHTKHLHCVPHQLLNAPRQNDFTVIRKILHKSFLLFFFLICIYCHPSVFWVCTLLVLPLNLETMLSIFISGHYQVVCQSFLASSFSQTSLHIFHSR